MAVLCEKDRNNKSIAITSSSLILFRRSQSGNCTMLIKATPSFDIIRFSLFYRILRAKVVSKTQGLRGGKKDGHQKEKIRMFNGN